MNPIPVRCWRLLIALSGLTGVLLAAVQYDVWWTALSQLASLAVALAFPFLAFAEPRSPWLRGALTTLMVLVCVGFLAMQHGNLWDPYSVFEHLLTPVLVVADFVLVGTNQAHVRAWHPLTWLLPPLLYLVWYVDADLRVYVALDASRPTAFTAHVGLLAVLVLLAGFALYDVGRRRRELRTA